MDQNIIIPIFGMLTGIIIPLAVFIWLYYEGKGKRETVLEISKNLEDPAKLEELLRIFDDRKKEPLDYRRNGVVTIFVGIGLFLLGFVAIGRILEGVGFLVAAIGVGTLIAGYLYPNTGKELTNAVEEFEKK
jgi:small-conductance mechanosensitive channel